MRSLAILPSLVVALLLACGPTPTTTTTVAPSEPSPQPAAQAPVQAPRTILLVRHAEKAGNDRDALLSDVGHARAQCLARTLGDAAITHAFATELQRTQQTLAPLLSKRSLTPTIIPAEAPADLLTALRNLPPAAVAVVAGHSNTLPPLLAELGNPDILLDHDEYDWLFVLTLPDAGPATLLRTHYCPA